MLIPLLLETPILFNQISTPLSLNVEWQTSVEFEKTSIIESTVKHATQRPEREHHKAGYNNGYT